MDAEFCKYMMGTARVQALAEVITALVAANEHNAHRIVHDMLQSAKAQATEPTKK